MSSIKQVVLGQPLGPGVRQGWNKKCCAYNKTDNSEEIVKTFECLYKKGYRLYSNTHKQRHIHFVGHTFCWSIFHYCSSPKFSIIGVSEDVTTEIVLYYYLMTHDENGS